MLTLNKLIVKLIDEECLKKNNKMMIMMIKLNK